LQSLFKRSLQCLTLFHIVEVEAPLRQPQYEQDYHQDYYGYR
jgi:hypothetical protein